jgi:hypothetical protein
LKPNRQEVDDSGRVTELLKPPDSLRGGGEPVPTRSGLKLRERAPGYIDTKLDHPELNPDTVAAAEQCVAPEPADAELVVHGSCRLFHGASVAAERVREHRTDRLKGCRSKTAPSSPLPPPNERQDHPALSKRTADTTAGCVLDIAPSSRSLGPRPTRGQL